MSICIYAEKPQPYMLYTSMHILKNTREINIYEYQFNIFKYSYSQVAYQTRKTAFAFCENLLALTRSKKKSEETISEDDMPRD